MCKQRVPYGAVRFLNSQFVGVANMPISAGNNIIDIQGATFHDADYILASGGTLGIPDAYCKGVHSPRFNVE